MSEILTQQPFVNIFYALYPVYKFFAHAGTRYFWIYCLTGLLFTAYLYYRQNADRKSAHDLFARETWTSISAQNDYMMLAVGGILNCTVMIWLLLNANTVAHSVASFIQFVGVSGTVNDTTALVLGGALTVTLFVADDFARFYAHYLMHRVPEFWEFHKVHHSAEVLNFTTAERVHPMEYVFSSVVIALTVGIVNGVFIGLFGNNLTVATVAGANIFLIAFNIFGGALRHSPVWLSFGPTVERWIISPAMHQVHHSTDPQHFDKNFGGALAVWDRWFGTLHIPHGREVKQFGLGEESIEFRKLSNIYFGPFAKSYRALKTRWSNAVGRTTRNRAA